jgi:hypothetical protein
MAKYQNAYRQEENVGTDTTYSQDVAVAEANGPDSEDATFKKRYGDLRRHMQQSMAQKDQELAQMRAQLDSATRKQIKFPKTEQEVAEWAARYPDVAKIIDTIAQKRAQEVLQVGEQKLQRVQQLELQLARDKAEAQLIKLHPDFNEIREDSAFHDWVAQQPQWVQDSLYKNQTDAMAAARAIDLYKSDTKKKPVRKSAAANSVGRTSSSIAPNTGRAKFRESQVERMSAQEYEQNEAAIMAAIQEGSFEYDLTGSAR